MRNTLIMLAIVLAGCTAVPGPPQGRTRGDDFDKKLKCAEQVGRASAEMEAIQDKLSLSTTGTKPSVLEFSDETFYSPSLNTCAASFSFLIQTGLDLTSVFVIQDVLANHSIYSKTAPGGADATHKEWEDRRNDLKMDVNVSAPSVK